MITAESIILIVSEYFKQPIDKVLSTSRKGELVNIRQISMYFIKLYIDQITLEKIGKYFPGKTGYKDHATVLFGVNKVIGYIETDNKYKITIGLINNKIVELFGIESAIEHIETKSEKFERLWQEREKVLISENTFLRNETVKLKNIISELQGTIYALKRSQRGLVKKKRIIPKFKITDIKIQEIQTTETLYKKKEKSNGKEYSGYREHQL